MLITDAQLYRLPGAAARGAVRDGLVAAGLEPARTGGPDAVVLRVAARIVGVFPDAANRHFADRDEFLAAVGEVTTGELATRMAAGVTRVRGKRGDAAVHGLAVPAGPGPLREAPEATRRRLDELTLGSIDGAVS